MLILARRPNEAVIITVGETRIEVLVLDTHDGRCRLGFAAPQEARIVRKELKEQDDAA